MKVYTLVAAAALLAALEGTAAHAQLYWDINAANNGSAGGATPAGTWDTTTPNWNTDSLDDSILGSKTTWNNGSAVFSAAGDATGAFGVTLDNTATVQTDGIKVEEGTVTISGGVGAGDQLSLNNGAVVDIADTLTTTISSIVGGSAGLNKSGGTGTLVLSGANTYSGVTSINAGTLAVSTAAGLGVTDTTTVNSGGTLQVSGTVSIPEHLDVNGDGFNSTGAIRKTGSNTTTLTGGVSLLSTSIINVEAGTLTISTTQMNGGAFTKNGTGTLTLSGAQNFTGTATVNAGILGVSNATGLGATSGGVVVNAGGTLQVSGGVSIAESTISLAGTGSSSNNGALRKTGNNTTTLSSQISGDGLITVTAGVLRLSSTGTANSGFTGPITVSGGGTLRYEFLVPNQTGTTGLITLNNGILENLNSTVPGNGSVISSTRDIFLDTGGGTFLYNTAGGLSIIQPGTIISGPGGLTKTGVGVVAIAEACTYSGPTHVVAGTLRVRTNNERYPNGTALTVDSGATFDVDGLTETVGSLAGAGTAELDSGTLAAGGDNTSTAFSGQITGASGKFTKQGTGTLTLSGNNTHTGLTTISTGAIAAQSNTALGTTAGATTVSSGAQLQIDGNGLSIAEPLTISGTGLTTTGAVRNLANSNTLSGAIALAANSRIQSSAGTLTVSGTIKSSSGTARNLTVGGAGNTTISGVIGDGTNPIGSFTKADAGTVTLSGANTFTGNTSVTGGTLSITNQSVLPDTSDVLLSTGTIFNLDFTGLAEKIDSLFFNGVSQLAGTWGATGSGAAHIDNTFFTGAGTVDVTTFVPPPGVPGDFNNNGFVDAADYVLWSRNRTVAGSAPPGTPALPFPATEVSDVGTTTNQDYTDWRARFGNPAFEPGAGGENLAFGQVPEPTSLALGAVAALGMAMLASRGRVLATN